jgi:hypothetical protein
MTIQEAITVAIMFVVIWCSGRKLLGDFRENKGPAGGAEEHTRAGQ